MKKSFLILLLISAVFWSAVGSTVMKNGVTAWSDRKYVISELPQELTFKNPVPRQQCNGYNIKLPPNTQKALIALCESPHNGQIIQRIVKTYSLQPLNKHLYIGTPARPRILKYALFAVADPPELINCRTTRAGGILLALNDDVPQVDAQSAADIGKLYMVPESLKGVKSFAGQEYRFRPGSRTVEYYVRAPKAGINANTGLMLVSHNWGGTWKYTAPWCDLLSDRFNLIALSVNYLQSGETNHSQVPYDHGVLQAMDCLRALYYTMQTLDAEKIPFNRRRLYAAGASGGGNVSLMVNKLAPGSFGCIIDLCGMPGLTNDIAFGIGQLNAGYSQDPQSPKYLTAAMQEIRDPGWMPHLKLQKQWNPQNKVVIVHGLDDTSCNPADKMVIAAGMVRAGFRPDTHFLTQKDIDGKIITNTGHAIGNRPEIIARFGGEYLSEKGLFAANISGQNDFDAAREIVYPVTGGKYIISFKGAPSIKFEKD